MRRRFLVGILGAGLIASGAGLATLTGTGCMSQGQPVVSASDTYQRTCARCHGARGEGGPPAAPGEAAPRSFADAIWQASRTDEELVSVIRDGKGSMPSFASALGASDIAAVVEVVRGFRPESSGP